MLTGRWLLKVRRTRLGDTSPTPSVGTVWLGVTRVLLSYPRRQTLRLGWCLISVLRNGFMVPGSLLGVPLLLLSLLGSTLTLKLKL